MDAALSSSIELSKVVDKRDESTNVECDDDDDDAEFSAMFPHFNQLTKDADAILDSIRNEVTGSSSGGTGSIGALGSPTNTSESLSNRQNQQRERGRTPSERQESAPSSSLSSAISRETTRTTRDDRGGISCSASTRSNPILASTVQDGRTRFTVSTKNIISTRNHPSDNHHDEDDGMNDEIQGLDQIAEELRASLDVDDADGPLLESPIQYRPRSVASPAAIVAATTSSSFADKNLHYDVDDEDEDDVALIDESNDESEADYHVLNGKIMNKESLRRTDEDDEEEEDHLPFVWIPDVKLLAVSCAMIWTIVIILIWHATTPDFLDANGKIVFLPSFLFRSKDGS